jgi:hypothetical protein
VIRLEELTREARTELGGAREACELLVAELDLERAEVVAKLRR